MSKIQKELSRIQKELKAPKSEYNTFGKYSYRTVDGILTAVKPLLGECAVILSDGLVELSTGVYVEATASLLLDDEIISVNGYAKEADKQGGMAPAQITGSSSSYSRKYALSGLFAIDDTKDDDATNKHGVQSPESAPKPKQVPKGNPVTPEQTIKVNNLLKNDVFNDTERNKGKVFMMATDEAGANKFIASLEARVNSAPDPKTPKEKLIDDVIQAGMIEWERSEDFVTNVICKINKVVSMSKMTVEDLKQLKSDIMDGTFVPF